jgi:predicted Zn-ribbon and HTH transcriptional regulator
MGTEYKVKCIKCGYLYTARIGGGTEYYLLHCSTCDEEKKVNTLDLLSQVLTDKENRDLDQLIELYAGNCDKCGSDFRINASPRCPRCHSDQYEEVAYDGKVTRVHYD